MIILLTVIRYGREAAAGLNVHDLSPSLDSLLRDLNHVYAEMANPLLTDYAR